MTTNIVIYCIPSLPVGELYCHISVDLGVCVYSVLLGSENHSTWALCHDNTHRARRFPTTQYLAMRWRKLQNTCPASFTCTHVHRHAHRQIRTCPFCSFCPWQLTHAFTRFPRTSQSIWCGKQGKQCGKQFIRFLL